MMTVKLCPSAVQIDNAPKVRCSATRGEEPGIELSPLDIEPSKRSLLATRFLEARQAVLVSP